ncbi:DUF2341 domain-containing protein, partial [Patescibacteria group bacterium]|nr:DUF2341 domain-containing protein [Patescibacteria group bacterium]
MKKRAKIKLIKSKNRAIYLARYLVYFVKLFVWKMKHKPKWKKTAKISAIATMYLVVSFASFLGIKKILSIPRAPKIKIADSNSPFIYTAKAKEFEVSLGDKKTNTPKVEFGISGNTITFTPASGREKINEPTIEDKALIFREVYPKVDYKYETTPKGIKEEIIIKQPTIIKQFPFYLDFEGVRPKYIAENLAGGVFYDEENNYLFHFEKPFAYDSAGVRTEDVQLLVKRDVETKKYVAIIGLDQDWASSPERKYPIYIDPTVVHDETSEFATGQFNRIKDTGSGSSPNLETYYQEIPADEHTVGLWHINETSNDTCSGSEDVCDSSGNGDHGTENGTVAIETTNQILGAAARTFDGTDDFINVPDSSTLDLSTAITLEGWVYLNDCTGTGDGRQTLISKQGAYYLNFDACKPSFYWYGLVTPGYHTANTAIPLTTWTHVAATYDGHTVKIYINGELDKYVSGITGAGTITALPVVIGGYAANNRNLDGYIDEVRVSGIARTPEEIKLNAQRRSYSVYTSDSINLGSLVYSLDSLEWTELGVQTGNGETVSSSTNLVSQWNFNETSGTNANNDAEGASCGGTPANCDGTLTGFSNTTGQDVAAGSGWTSDNRRWGTGALMFNGTSDYVNAGSDSVFDMGATDIGSIEVWFKTTNTAKQTLVSRVGAVTPWPGYVFDVNQNTSSKKLAFWDGSTWTDGTTEVTDGNWHHGAVVISGTSLTIYLDGKVDGTATIADLSSISQSLWIGQANSGSEFFSGDIDSVRFYSRAISASEVLSNYQAGQIEFQTRSSTDGSSWEAWKPTTNETQILSLDSDVGNWEFQTGSTISNLPILTKNTNPSAPTGPTGCSSNKPVEIKNLGNTTSLTSFQVKLEIDYLSGMSSDFSDLRFTNSSGTDLDYWLETHTASTNATVWIEVDSIPAQKNTILFMWYNSCTGGNASNGDDTFSFFDDFEDGTISATKWPTQSLGSYITETGGELKMTGVYAGTYYIQSAAYTQADLPMVIEARVKTVTVPTNGWSPVMWWQSTTEGASILEHPTNLQYTRNDGTWLSIGNYPISTYHHDALVLSSTSGWTARSTFEDSTNTQWFDDYSNTFSGTYYIKIGPRHENGDYGLQSMDGRIDAIYTRKYASVEPTAKVTTPSAVPSMEGSSSLQTTLGRPQLDNDTVALFHLDETSGTGAYLKDETNYDNDATPTGTSAINGFSDKGRNFASGNYIAHPVNGFYPKEKTIEMWVKPNWNGNDSVTHGIWQNNNTTSVDQANWVSLFKYSTNILYFRVVNPSAGLQDCTYNTASNTYFSTGKWVHIVATYSASGMSVYLDGNRVCNTGAITAPTSNLDTIARIGYGYSTYSFGSGVIDEVKISNSAVNWEYAAEAYRAGSNHRVSRTISSTDLSAKGKLPFYVAADRPGTYLETTAGESDYFNQETDTNTAGYWHLEEKSGTGTYLKDSSSNGNNGTPSGAAFTQGKTGGARKFDGLDDYISIAHNSTLEPSNLSMEAWINVDSSITPETYAVIIDKPHSTHVDPYYNYHIRLDNLTNTNPDLLSCVIVGASGGDCISATSSITKNSWHYIVVTFDGTTQKLYLDGQLRGTLSNPGSITYSQQSLYIGAFKNLTNGNFPGLIDEVRISSTARTADEVRQAYETGTRTHPITIDFAASLDSGNLIADSSDTSFTVDATSYGLNSMGSNLYEEDKIIVKENVDGTEYIAQGDVTTITASTGAATVDAWDTGSTFPAAGYTVDASVFKWQREYWDITKPLDSQVNAITNLTLRVTDGNEGRTIWLDDLESSGDYLTDESGSTITSTAQDYFQYRAILSSTNTNVAPSLTSVTLDYTENSTPGAPTLNASYLHDKLKTADTTPEIRFAATDTETDDLSYQVQWDTDSSFPDPSSAVSDTDAGFSNITTPADTDPFNSGDTISYIFQSALTTDTTYYYKIRAKDPGGSNTYGDFSSIRSFTIDSSFGNTDGWHETHADQFTSDTLTGGTSVNDSGNYVETGDIAVIDNADTAGDWSSSDTTNLIVSQETTIKQEGTGSVKLDAASYVGDGSDGALNVTSGTTTLDTDANPGGFDYTSVTVSSGAVLTATGSNPLLIRATGVVDIQGTLHVDGGSGENGGAAAGAGGIGISDGGNGGAGASSEGNGSAGLNTGGGGGGIHCTSGGDVGGGGAGGSFGSQGTAGGNTYCDPDAQPTSTYGSVDLSTLEGGSGGGGGAADTDTSTERGAGGGGGGGAVQIAANTVSISGNLTADGGNGGNHINANDGEAGAGGGGSGGAIKILSTSVTITGTVSASGGSGGTSQEYGTTGGNGGNGRIRIEADSISGSTTPAASTTTTPEYSVNDTATLTTTAQDLSSYPNITFWVRSDRTGQFMRFEFGESASNEQTYNITVNSADTWEQKTWDISGISGAARDAITKYAFRITNDDQQSIIYFDDIQSDYGGDSNTITSTAITAANINSSASTWGRMAFADDETYGDITYKVYYDVTGTPTIIPDVDLPGNSTGFDTSPIALSGLSTTTYPILYAYAYLTYSGGSPQLQDWTVSFNLKPNLPTLDLPTDTDTGVPVTAVLKTTATDPDTDNIQYKIELCEDVGMSVNCQTFNQVSSQTGWSG